MTRGSESYAKEILLQHGGILIIFAALTIKNAFRKEIQNKESGIAVADDWVLHSDRNYSCFYGSSYVTETVGDE